MTTTKTNKTGTMNIRTGRRARLEAKRDARIALFTARLKNASWRERRDLNEARFIVQNQ